MYKYTNEEQPFARPIVCSADEPFLSACPRLRLGTRLACGRLPQVLLRLYSDTRTLLTSDSVHFGGYPAAEWGGTLRTQTGDANLYLNAIETTAGAGFDPNLGLYSPPSPLDYFDASGVPGSYYLGTPIPGGVDWSLREIASFENDWNSATPAAGIYDFTVTLRGGASATAMNALATFDLHLEVADRLDADIVASSTPIIVAGGTSRVSIAATNRMNRSLAITAAIMGVNGLRIDPLDPQSPGLDGSEAGDWKNKVIAPGQTLTGAHSDWTTNDETVNGTYTGKLGLVGGLHYGDFYYLYANPGPSVTVKTVQGVPEPASGVALALGAAAFLRRRATLTNDVRPRDPA